MTEPTSGPGYPSVTLRPAPRAQQLRWLGAAAAGAALVAGLGYLTFHRAESPEPVRESAPEGVFRATPQQLRTLTIEAVASHSFTTIEVADGRIAANGDRSTPVYPPFSGRVVAVIAAPGESVAAGAPLATVESPEFVQAGNDFAVAVAQLKLTQAAETRKHALLDDQGASRAEVEQAEADLATARAAVAAVEHRLRILGRSTADIERLRAGATIEARLALTAPLAGVIVDRQLGPGQYLQAGASQPVFTIADTRTVWAVGNVPESDAGRLRRGQAIEVRVPAWPDRTFSAHLNFVAATIDPATHRLTVRAELPNTDGALKPEMLATLRIATGSNGAALGVPEGAVIYDGEQAHVWVVTDDHAVGLRAVRTGRTSDGFVEIVDGLRAGDKVVTRGSLFMDRAARPD